MLAFITTLRHPDNAADYGRVESLLKDSLRSVCAQTSDDYLVFIVGNVEPTFPLPPRVHFVPVDFAAPAAQNGVHASLSHFVLDKGSKVGAGLLAAAKYAPDAVMLFDADDFVSNRLCEFVNGAESKDPWVIRNGFMLSGARYSYRAITDFNLKCGTCFVVPMDLYRVPHDLTARSSQQAIVDGFGDTLPNIMGAHSNALKWFRQQGRPAQTLPFAGAVYHVDTGENHSGKKMYRAARAVGGKFAAEFGLTPAKPTVKQLLDSFGPRYCAQSVREHLRRRKASRSAA